MTDFATLHVKGRPLVLQNVWDAGSAQAVAKAGAAAIATGSWSIAAAQGYSDGEGLPLVDVLRTARQIVGAVALPVSLDFEGGYAIAPEEVAQNICKVIDCGVVGINFEDRIVAGKGLHDISAQAARIAAIRSAAGARGASLFINARTDVFFQGDASAPDGLLQEVLTRAEAYRNAGADGLFVPGLSDLGLIAQLTAATSLPVNVMRMGKSAPSIVELAKAGVARISHGPGPYVAAMSALEQATKNLS